MSRPVPSEARCYAKGCTSNAKPNQLMCWPHWKRVPRIIQDAVWTSNHLAHPEYESSRLAARRAVALKEGFSLKLGDKDLLGAYAIGLDGYPEKVTP